MVHLIVEHLLSTSGNRLLYESLWNLAVTKSYKSGNSQSQGGLQNHDISAICNDLIREIKRDDHPDRNKFYFSTQIVFGTLMLYRLQVDKLYDQVKNALLVYNSTFYQIDWLAQVDNNPSYIENEHTEPNKSKKKSQPKQQKKTEQQRKKQDFDKDFDMIERVLEVQESSEPKSKKRKTKASLNEDTTTDPTMAVSVNQITILETNNTTTNPLQTFDDEEFGAFDPTFDMIFENPAQKNAKNSISAKYNFDQEVPECLNPLGGSPDNLRRAASTGQDQLEEHEYSLSENIQEILDSLKKPLKRRSSNTNDISHRLEPPFKQPRFEENSPDQLNYKDESHLLVTTIPSFDNSANDVGIDSVTKKNDEYNTFDISDPPNLIELAFDSPKTPIPQVLKKLDKKKSKHLMMDKQTSVKKDPLKESFLYQKKCVVDSPLDTFLLQSFHLKSSVEKLFHTPASRLRICAEKLLPVFDRNLIKVSSKLLKRKINDENQENQLSPPQKRQRFENQKKITAKKIIFDHEEQIKEQLALPAVEGLTEPSIILDHPIVAQNLLPEFDDYPLLPLVDLPEETRSVHVECEDSRTRLDTKNVTPAEKCVAEPRIYREDLIEYKECDKWSKTKIISNLKVFWKKKDVSITMEKLTSQTNRFVAAGIFFELMVLSKIGAVELTQGSNLNIANISVGKNKKLKM